MPAAPNMRESGAMPSDDDLAGALRQLAARAYAPYSNFHVAALALDGDGAVIASGVNVENASYGLSLCAETVALAAAATAGRLAEVRRIAIIGGRMDGGQLAGQEPVLPCGRCRQIINESAALQGRDIAILAFSGDGLSRRITSIAALLPDAFGPESL